MPAADEKEGKVARGNDALISDQAMSVELTEAIGQPVHVELWDGSRFRRDRKLQDAPRSRGEVVLMLDTRAEERGLAGEFARVAVKQIPNAWMLEDARTFDKMRPTATERPWQDIGTVKYLNSIGYPYTCELMGVFRDNEKTYIASSLASLGDLYDWCAKDPPLPGAERLRAIFPIVVQVLDAVRWLHDLGISHRDLSVENILLTEARGGAIQVRIIDFGMSTTRRKFRGELCGKFSYQAPEMHGVAECDGFLTDAFALGVTAFALATNDYPWDATKPEECRYFRYAQTHGLRRLVERRRIPADQHGEFLMDVLSEPFFEVVEGLSQLDAAKRLTLGEASWTLDGSKRRSVWDCGWMQDHQGAIEAALLCQGHTPPGSAMSEKPAEVLADKVNFMREWRGLIRTAQPLASSVACYA